MPPQDWNSETDRILQLTLDEDSISRSSPAVEHERQVALHDLLEANSFRLTGEGAVPGPYRVQLALSDGRRLHFRVRDEENAPLREIILSLSPFRRQIRDYFEICESYYDAIKRLSPAKIETIDMARRGLHNEGAEQLRERLDGKLDMDRHTARQLYTLICALHLKGWNGGGGA